jgi:hypothetical protein
VVPGTERFDEHLASRGVDDSGVRCKANVVAFCGRGSRAVSVRDAFITLFALYFRLVETPRAFRNAAVARVRTIPLAELIQYFATVVFRRAIVDKGIKRRSAVSCVAHSSRDL